MSSKNGLTVDWRNERLYVPVNEPLGAVHFRPLRTLGAVNRIERRRVTLPQAIASELRRKIATGELGPGQQLPGHRELAVAFSVSVGTIREAISMLVSSGLIETRAARGTFVVDNAKLPTVARLPVERREAEELIEARRVVELEIAGLAAERASQQQIEQLRSRVAAMAAAIESPAAYLAADIAFHVALGEAAGNRFLLRALEDVWSRLSHDMELSAETAIRRFGNLGFSIPSHQQLVDAIEAHDGAEARRIARGLMDRSHEFVLGVYALRPPDGD